LLNLSGVSIDPRERQKTIDAIKSLLKTFNARIPESADKSQTLNKMEVTEISPYLPYITAWGGVVFFKLETFIPFVKMLFSL